MPVVIEEYKPVGKNTLRGVCRVRFPSGLIIAEIKVHVRDGRRWASPPSRQIVDRDGLALRDHDGKFRWQDLITFANKNVRDAWSHQIIQAPHDRHPEVFRDTIPEVAA